MGINGVRSFEVTLPPEAYEESRKLYTAGQLAVFGAQRMAEAGDMPTPESVTLLTGQIEELCTGTEGRQARGVYSRTLYDTDRQFQLSWNPAGIMGGFGASREWDGPIARIDGLDKTRIWTKLPCRSGIRPYAVNEAMIVDGEGVPYIRRAVRPLIGKGAVKSWLKPATECEVESVSAQLSLFLARDYTTQKGNLPVFLEVGYGLDPMAIRGNRRFTTKQCIEVDKAVGAYENAYGDYAEAVRTRSQRFAQYAASEMTGQYLTFILGDSGRLPLQDRTVRELFMSNVLNAPVEDGMRSQALDEAQRTLQTNGALVIRVNWHQDVWSLDRIIRLLDDHGFTATRSVDMTDPEYAVLESLYGIPQEVAAPSGYYLISFKSGLEG